MVSKTKHVRRTVTSLLKNIHKNVHYQKASKDAEFPYITYSLDGTGLTGSRRDRSLVIDIWDKGQTTTRIEDIADIIEEKFEMLNVPNENPITFYLEWRGTVEDEDPLIKHEQIRVEMKYY